MDLPSNQQDQHIQAIQRLFLFFCLMLLLGFARPGLAEQEAKDITADCKLTVNTKAFSVERLRDRDYRTAWIGEGNRKLVTFKSAQPMHGIYLCFRESPKPFVYEQRINGKWVAATYPGSPYQHIFLPLDGASELKLQPEGRNHSWFVLAEVFIYGEGSLPDTVQFWQEPEPGIDLLLLFAHPDDEALFFGGTIPTYAGQRQLDVLACVIGQTTPVRHSELLNSLWTMGLRTYPVTGPFYDQYSQTLASAYKNAGERKVKAFVVELFRKYQPKVVVTHDVAGEYGHGMHMMCADAALHAFDRAADPSLYAQSAEVQGVHQVSKLYLHLYPENPIEMDWDLPLPAFSGRTGFEMAKEAYLQHQTQQHIQQFKVEPRDSAYSSYRFGLARSVVGLDVAQNDLMEHITGITDGNFLVETP